MSEYEFGEWRIWNGVGFPVREPTLVQPQFRDDCRYDAEARDPDFADAWAGWKHGGGAYDIIAYRIATRKAPEVVRRYVHSSGWMITRGDYVGCKYLLIFEVDADGNPQNPRFEALK